MNLRAVAHIRKVFGVKGEVKIHSYARTAEDYERIPALYLGKDENTIALCEVESVKQRGDELYLKLKGVDDRTKAEFLTGQFLFVEESQRKKLPKGKNFLDEILGCDVVGEDGKKFGILKRIDQYPAQQLYAVKTNRGEVLLPVVDEFILSVDVEKKEIIIRPPEGLFDGEMME